MNISPQNNRLEFERFLFERNNLDLFKFKFLDSYIRAVNENEKVVYSDSLLNVSKSGWILILHGDILLIYGENWSSDQLMEIKTSFDLNKFKNYTVTGDSELINQLLHLYQIPKTIQKERIFYKSSVIQKLISDELSIELGNQTDLMELAQMLKQYYREEYKGLNDKTIEEMASRVEQMILSKTIFVLRNQKNSILSFCTIINPDIGILFTQPNERNKGYGKTILSYCSNLLLKKNTEIYLMTDKNEISSNSTCKKLGFEPFYNYQQITINNG